MVADEFLGETIELCGSDTRSDSLTHLGERLCHQLIGSSHQLDLVFGLQIYHEFTERLIGTDTATSTNAA